MSAPYTSIEPLSKTLWAKNFVGTKWFDEPSHILVQGYGVERVREYYNFWLGTRLSRIAMLQAGMSRIEVFNVLYPVGSALDALVQEKFAPLPMCMDTGIELMKLIQGVLLVNPNKVLSGEDSTWTMTDDTIARMRDAAGRFDTALAIQFDHLDTYRVMPKGTHDTRKLIELPELAFENLWKHLADLAQKDWAASSRCLAFDLPTACGFHCLRAMEATTVQYLKLKSVTAPGRDLGQYVKTLVSIGADPATTDLIEQLRKHHRNPLMHPEDTLDVPQALAVFDLTKSAIILLVKDMLAKGIIT
jgi:hypothetical protein